MMAAPYFQRVLLGLDQFANAIVGGNPSDTISYRAAVARSKGECWGCVFCRILNLLQKDHCDKAIAAFDAQIEQDAQELSEGEQPL